ncbi:histone-lysine N-methyltransferase SETMAR-like [Dama dama]|uniref:histone-lysine N-methyltransferase SETMAR-like n=1 Tax=Dama dama TaxID=30532 RepID=UPI002A371A84|nr:histone-lysine N-methyltransferase SETMAR-like [Dama dama]
MGSQRIGHDSASEQQQEKKLGNVISSSYGIPALTSSLKLFSTSERSYAERLHPRNLAGNPVQDPRLRGGAPHQLSFRRPPRILRLRKKGLYPRGFPGAGWRPGNPEGCGWAHPETTWRASANQHADRTLRLGFKQTTVRRERPVGPRPLAWVWGPARRRTAGGDESGGEAQWGRAPNPVPSGSPTTLAAGPSSSGGGRSISGQATQLREGSRRAAALRHPALARPAATMPKRKVISAEGSVKEETMKMMLEKKQIRAIFLFEFKMGRKAAETTRNINNAFGPGTAKERTVQWWFKKFRQGDESLEDDERSARPSEVDNDQLREIIDADPLKTTRKIAEELKVNHSTVVRHLKQIGKVKKLNKWVPHELTENQKNRRFEVSSSLILRNNNEPFLDRIVTCHEKWILSDNRQQPAQRLDQGKTLNLYPKKIMVTVWWSAAGLIHYSFLNPGETITSEKYAQQINEMHQKLQHLQPALVNRKGPVLLHDNARPHVAQPALQKFNELGYEVLPHPPYSPDLLPTDYHFFKHLDNFLQGKHFHNQQDAENAFQEFVESQSTGFYTTGINELTSRWQKCVDCNGSYFD